MEAEEGAEMAALEVAVVLAVTGVTEALAVVVGRAVADAARMVEEMWTVALLPDGKVTLPVVMVWLLEMARVELLWTRGIVEFDLPRDVACERVVL